MGVLTDVWNLDIHVYPHRAVFPKGGRDIHEELMSWYAVGDGKNPLLQWKTTWSQRWRVQDGLIEVMAIAIESCKDLLVLQLSHTTCFWVSCLILFGWLVQFDSIWRIPFEIVKPPFFYKVANWRLLIDPHGILMLLPCETTSNRNPCQCPWKSKKETPLMEG